jgi:hypothetical protein
MSLVMKLPSGSLSRLPHLQFRPPLRTHMGRRVSRLGQTVPHILHVVWRLSSYEKRFDRRVVIYLHADFLGTFGGWQTSN